MITHFIGEKTDTHIGNVHVEAHKTSEKWSWDLNSDLHVSSARGGRVTPIRPLAFKMNMFFLLRKGKNSFKTDCIYF